MQASSFPSGPLEAHCLGCQRDSIYYWAPRESSEREAQYKDALISAIIAVCGIERLFACVLKVPDSLCRDATCRVSTGHRWSHENAIRYKKDLLKTDKQLRVDWLCFRETAHAMTFYIHVLGGRLMKVGQFPSLADFQLPQIEKYRTVLADKQSEFHRAIGLAAHGVGVGAFVYLRRIFEQLIEEARKKSVEDSNLDEETFSKGRMPEKIELLKDYLPAFLVKNKSLYGILSKGIHELTEEECRQYFSIVRNGIEFIPDERLGEKEKIRKIRATEREITQLTTKLKQS